jgi:PAS domain-containing protein
MTTVDDGDRQPLDSRLRELVAGCGDGAELRSALAEALAALDEARRRVRELETAADALREEAGRDRRIAELVADFSYGFRVEPDGSVVNEWLRGDVAGVTGFDGVELAAAVGRGWEGLAYQEDLAITLRQLRALLSGRPEVVEYRIVTRGGELRWVRNRGMPVRAEGSSRITHLCGAVTDITHERAVVDQQLETEARLRAAIESLPFDFFALDTDGRYVLQNSTCRQRWGEVIGKRPDDVAPNLESLALWQENNRRAWAGETVDERVQLTLNGQRSALHNIIAPIRKDGAVIGILGINIWLESDERPRLGSPDGE